MPRYFFHISDHRYEAIDTQGMLLPGHKLFTATGFRRSLYVRYHGYRKFFPLWRSRATAT